MCFCTNIHVSRQGSQWASSSSSGDGGRTWSVVNFESVNSRNEGRYFQGFDATCAVAEPMMDDTIMLARMFT